jgi:hypothetical protein
METESERRNMCYNSNHFFERGKRIKNKPKIGQREKIEVMTSMFVSLWVVEDQRRSGSISSPSTRS